MYEMMLVEYQSEDYCIQTLQNVRLSLSLAGVWRDIVWSPEHLEGWVSLDTVVLAKFRLFRAVDLRERDVLLLKSGSSLLVLWGKGLAVAAPWCEDY